MNQQKLLQDVASLPPLAQQEAIDFIAFLKQRYIRHPVSKNKLSSIDTEPFIGMWKNRADMSDSSAWVRNLRQNEWG
jgi:hypothetical protein